MNDFGKMLLMVGVALALVELLLWSGFGKGWFGRSPGLFHYSRGSLSFHFGLVPCLLAFSASKRAKGPNFGVDTAAANRTIAANSRSSARNPAAGRILGPMSSTPLMMSETRQGVAAPANLQLN